MDDDFDYTSLRPQSPRSPTMEQEQPVCARCGSPLDGDETHATSLVHLLTEICVLQKDLLRQSGRQMRQAQEMSAHQFEKAMSFQAQHLEKTLTFHSEQIEETYRRVQQSQNWQKLGIIIVAAIVILLVVIIFLT